jgi:hypothetical protein
LAVDHGLFLPIGTTQTIPLKSSVAAAVAVRPLGAAMLVQAAVAALIQKQQISL